MKQLTNARDTRYRVKVDKQGSVTISVYLSDKTVVTTVDRDGQVTVAEEPP